MVDGGGGRGVGGAGDLCAQTTADDDGGDCDCIPDVLVWRQELSDVRWREVDGGTARDPFL